MDQRFNRQSIVNKMTRTIVVLLSLCGVSLATYCGHIYAEGVSHEEASLIVNKHNEFRKLIANGQVPGQPRGVNLKGMKYDERLADDAQKIANTCEFAHKHVDDGRWHAVGQNLYIMYSTAPTSNSDWSAAIQGWFDEHTDYKFRTCCDSGPIMTGHYTQLVWANTEFVGCGYTYFESNDFWKFRKLYVCNYGPAGNYIGRVPYEVGTSGCENLC